MLQGILIQMFHERPGATYVVRGDYRFLCHEGEKIVDQDQWSETVQEGMVFEMAVILQNDGNNLASKSKNCPACRKVCHPSNYRRKGWITWWASQLIAHWLKISLTLHYVLDTLAHIAMVVSKLQLHRRYLAGDHLWNLLQLVEMHKSGPWTTPIKISVLMNSRTCLLSRDSCLQTHVQLLYLLRTLKIDCVFNIRLSQAK